MRSGFRYLALGCFFCYLALFPGSTTTVALDAVPAWGVWMGAALLMLQGIAAFAWLLGRYGRHGLVAGGLAFLLAWAVEHIGETTGRLFGRYQYTDVLQPQILAVVPVPITCAWLIVALGSWQLAGWLWNQPQQAKHRAHRQAIGRMGLSATLVVVLDLQIETVATLVNRYWVWVDHGTYYGVPTANFIMWWVVGLAMGLLLWAILPDSGVVRAQRVGSSSKQFLLLPAYPIEWSNARIMRGQLYAWLFTAIPALMYLLSSVMFTIINISYGFLWAGGIGVVLLSVVLLQAVRSVSACGLPIVPAVARVGHQTSD
jgi:putative membrane protein